jgi:hypothetical protein
MAVNLFFFAHQPLQQAEILLIAIGREIEVAGNANKLLLFNRLFMLFHERLIGPPRDASRGGTASDRREVAACQDRRIDAGKRFLRNDGTSLWLEGLENKAECLSTPMQIVDYSRAVACLVGRGPGVDVLHSVTHGVVEEDCDLSSRGGHGLSLTDAWPSGL